ncbi:sugar phosphate isomerase/epimerase family protein [Amycolatopsis sp., V23-08]|uniref:Sugar phosphate isomerase/epimerase family protein n=1 Tax=Amycolatopsis heterodermiae TaxID=3110235 RepID=A0ABU5RMX1_9PSEU|nr:sugar phosphate isomerase/epimerase family protein [Amycolatopsis sp., V23-08]MEA5367661.1 sugar phosphate isomerase/epimerase family protein [Amycolatopsis sp., V23-08]
MGWRFAVSTLGMPGVPVREAARTALAHGCEGLELRVHPDEEVHLGLANTAVGDFRSLLDDQGLAVACLAGYAKVCRPGPDGPVVDELRALIELAHGIGAPSVRVFPGGDGEARPRIEAVLDDLRGSGVRLLLETHDSRPTGAAAREVVEPFGDPDLVAVLWDAVHPWRAGEEPAVTRDVLGRYLGYFQVKDAVGRDDPTPVPPGEGAIPLAECGELLRSWSGWVSLEWEKAWYPDLAAVDVPLRAAAAWFGRYAHPDQ